MYKHEYEDVSVSVYKKRYFLVETTNNSQLKQLGFSQVCISVPKKMIISNKMSICAGYGNLLKSHKEERANYKVQ